MDISGKQFHLRMHDIGRTRAPSRVYSALQRRFGRRLVLGRPVGQHALERPYFFLLFHRVMRDRQLSDSPPSDRSRRFTVIKCEQLTAVYYTELTK